MRRTEERERTTRESYLVEVVCDLCGATQGAEHRFVRPLAAQGWLRKPQDALGDRHIEITVRMDDKHYNPSPEARITVYDLCPECFGRLDAWLREQGATPRVREIDW